MACRKAEKGECPHRMGEPQDPHLERLILRGIRRLLPVDSLLPDGYSLRPDVVVLIPTLRCNLHCPYCFQGAFRNGKGKPKEIDEALGLTDWQRIIEEIQPFGLPVIVMGGELFLYPQALQLLRSIKAANLPLTVITNGSNLSQVASELVEIGLNTLIVSIDGPEEVHNFLRGHPRGFQLALEGIRLTREARGVCRAPFIQVSCTISAATQGHLYEFEEQMMLNGVERVVFNSLIFNSPAQAEAQREVMEQVFGLRQQGSALAHQAYLGIDPDVLRREIDLVRSSPWSKRVFIEPPGVEQNLEAYYHPEAPPFEAQECSAAFRELWVYPDGSVGACGHLPELVMGNIKNNGLLSIWNGPLFRKFRQTIKQGLLPGCARCEKLTYEQAPIISACLSDTRD